MIGAAIPTISTFLPSSSAHSDSTKFSSNAFVAEYITSQGCPPRPAPEDMITMPPPPRFRKRLPKPWVASSTFAAFIVRRRNDRSTGAPKKLLPAPSAPALEM